ncbi:MAG TPA: hypothetical protein VGJ29_16985 [Vicinamibacterales bacterium]|jgi:hypothetical protein
MTPCEVEEYRALRATIRERGTTRVWVFTVGLIAWAGLAVATAGLGGVPVAALVPLIVLAGTFEAVFALHIGVERIGRYIQVFYEEGATASDTGPRASHQWEHAISAFGRGVPGGATDPLFAWIFATATLLNFTPVLLAEPVAVEVATLGAAHFAFLVRVALAMRASKRQRAFELARFTEMKDRMV